jgi:MFS family permease
MTTRREVGVVYAAGLFQGVALVTFPAASGILTSADFYGLSVGQYGSIFLPQAILAVTAALAGASLTRRLTTKTLLLVGLAADIGSMLLLLGSQALEGSGAVIAVLFLATSLLGLGFGLVVPALNTLAAAFFPSMVGRAVLILNALLGLGTALAPVLVAAFTGLGAWWGLPLSTAVFLAIVLVLSLRLPLDTRTTAAAAGAAEPLRIPRRFWLFAAATLVYGIVETLNGNWAVLDVTSNLQGSAAAGSLALTAFWGMVTVGRLLFAGIEKWIPERATYRALPLLLAVAFWWISSLEPGSASTAIVAFGLAGLGCSALLPLNISFGQQHLPTMVAAVSGALIAAYQIGYGIAAFGVPPLREATGLSLSQVFLVGAALAVAMAVLNALVLSGRPKGSSRTSTTPGAPDGSPPQAVPRPQALPEKGTP